MDDEIDSLRKTQTWILLNPPSNHQIINNQWTYKLKMNNDVFNDSRQDSLFQTNCWS